jgi:hypothetical protein
MKRPLYEKCFILDDMLLLLLDEKKTNKSISKLSKALSAFLLGFISKSLSDNAEKNLTIADLKHTIHLLHSQRQSRYLPEYYQTTKQKEHLNWC